MLLQDPDLISPVMPVEVRAQAVPRAGESWEFEEGARALLCRLWKAHAVYLGLVYCLDDRQPITVDCGLSPVHTAAVFRNGP